MYVLRRAQLVVYISFYLKKRRGINKFTRYIISDTLNTAFNDAENNKPRYQG